MELILKHAPYYRVKRGQTLALIAETFRIPVSVLVKENALEKEVEEGQVLSIPASRFHLYRVREQNAAVRIGGAVSGAERDRLLLSRSNRIFGLITKIRTVS